MNQLLSQEDGQAVIEYSVLAVAVAAVVVTVVTTLGLQVQGLFQQTVDLFP
jgi:Flp pilus assembly pilin Flp